MRNLILLLIFFMLFLISNGADVYEKSFSSVVLVKSKSKVGAGVFITAQGHILTNYHVIKDAIELEIFIKSSDSTDKSYKAFDVIKFDETKDLALLKILDSNFNFNFIQISLVVPKIGSNAHAIGHPNGEEWSYSKGYIAQKNTDYVWHYKDGSRMVGDTYQIQNPISKGNSGGPLLNDSGNLIGINTFITKDDESLNYSIGVKDIIEFLAD
tara:strand:- start:47 stop:682 length:636 start_codon:yes stop_codon:yes gene_type:complete